MPYDALNKSAVTGIPIHWTPGFHFASVSPEFNDLYLFHMKLADIDMQVAIGAAVAAQADQAQFQEYHRSSRAKIEANLNSIRTFQTIDGWAGFDRSVYQASFMEGIRYVPEYGGVYHGRPFAVERVLLRIPKEFGNHL